MQADADSRPQLSLITVLKGAGFTFLGTMLGRVLVFVAKAIIGDDLGPDLFGLFNIGFSSLVLLQFVALGGFYEGVSAYISTYRAEKRPEAVSRVLFTGATLGIAFGVGLATMVWFSADWIAVGVFDDERLGTIFRIIAILLPLYCMSQVVLGFLRGIKHIRQMVVARNVWGDVTLIIAVALVTSAGLGINGAFGAFAFKQVLVIGAAIYFISRSELARTFRAHPTHRIDAPLVRYSIPVTAALTLETVRLYAETLVLGPFVGSEQVGLFSSALLISSLLLILGAAFRPILLPVIAELHVANRERDVFRLYVTVVKYVTFAATPCALSLLLFPEAIILLIFNESYLPAVMPLRMLGTAYFVSACLGNYTAIFYATGRQKLDLLVKSVGTGLSLALNFVLIPRYGIMGATTAHSVSLVCTEILGSLLATRGQRRVPRMLQPLRVLALSSVVFLIETAAVRALFADFEAEPWAVPLIGLMVILNGAIVLRFVPLDARERAILRRARRRFARKSDD